MFIRTLSICRSGFAAGFIASALLGFGTCSAQDPVASPILHADEYLHDLVLTEGYVATAEQALKAEQGSNPQAWANKLNSNPQAWGTKLRIHLAALTGLAGDRANIGDAQGAIAAFTQKAREEEKVYGAKIVGAESADLAAIDGSHAEDAVAAIARAARSRQVVILNEAHHVPFDRIFALHLARALRKQGFEYLACETFNGSDEHVLQRGYVVDKTGVFSHEQTYVKFLMDAKTDGWKFVSYEPSTEPRESGMAKNLIKRIFLANQKAKVFVYAGYSHAKKLPVSHSDDDGSKLAAQLLRLTGIDPLTINQTTLFAQYNSAQQARYYAHAVRKLKTRVPAVLVSASGKPVRLSIDDLAYDFEVVHPAYVDDPATHRPEWLSEDFTPHDIPKDMLSTKARRAIYAYSRDTAADAVPIDVVMLQPGKPVPKLMLPPGDFVFEYED